MRLFRENVHDDERSGRPSLVNDNLVRAIEEKIRENRLSLLPEIVFQKLGYRKLCARWVPKLLTEEHRMKRRASASGFREAMNAKFLGSVQKVMSG